MLLLRSRLHGLVRVSLGLAALLVLPSPAAAALVELESTSSGQVASSLLSPDSLLHGSLAVQHPFMIESAQAGPDAVPRPRDSGSSRLRLRIGTLNIRYDVHSRHPLLKPATDLLQRKWGEQRWHRRRDQLVDQVLFHDLDVVGFQEVLHHQLLDLAELMGESGADEDGWAHVGVGRDDGKEAGEAVPIFYRT